MIKTLCKLLCLLMIIACLVFFFKAAQEHDWIAVAIWAGLVCMWANDYDKFRWKNVAITTMIDGKVIDVSWYWTNRGARKEFDKVTAEVTRRFREAGLPVYDHTTTEKK